MQIACRHAKGEHIRPQLGGKLHVVLPAAAPERKARRPGQLAGLLAAAVEKGGQNLPVSGRADTDLYFLDAGAAETFENVQTLGVGKIYADPLFAFPQCGIDKSFHGHHPLGCQILIRKGHARKAEQQKIRESQGIPAIEG